MLQSAEAFLSIKMVNKINVFLIKFTNSGSGKETVAEYGTICHSFSFTSREVDITD